MPATSEPSAQAKAATRANYNRLSGWYDALAGGSERHCMEVGLRQLNPGEGERVLEIGFGTGRGLVGLAQAVGVSGKVCGLDLSEGMLKVARARVEAAGLTDRIELRAGDAAQLPYPDSVFQAVFMSFALELFDTLEIARVLAGCHRVLRPGGRLGVVAMAQQDPPGLPIQLYLWAHRRWPTLVDCRPIPVRACLEAAHFQITTAARLSVWGLPVDALTAHKV